MSLFETIDYNTQLLPEVERWLSTESIVLGELLNADGNSFSYNSTRGIYTYYDSKQNLFFVRLAYEPTAKPYFILKTGWFQDNDFSKPIYEPSLPQEVSPYDKDQRTNTVAKIYRDEIIPLFIEQSLSNILKVEPISVSRYQFSIRLIKKYTPEEFTIIEDKPSKITIIKP